MKENKAKERDREMGRKRGICQKKETERCDKREALGERERQRYVTKERI